MPSNNRGDNRSNNRGQFQQGDERTREAASRGGESSSGQFQRGDQRTVEAARKGGEHSRGSNR